MATVIVLTNTGKQIITGALKQVASGAGSAEPKYIGWGTGAGTAAATDSTLFTEASEARVAGTSTQETTTVANDTYQVVGTLTAAAGKTITNAATFDASTAGNIFIKASFDGLALNAGDSIELTFKATT